MKPSHFRRTFITGLLFILPIVVSIWLVRFAFEQISASITPLVLQLIRLFGIGQWGANMWLDYLVPLLSVAFAVFIIWLIGLIGVNVIGRRLLKRLEDLMLQVPVIKGIYSATRQFIDTFSKAGSKAFKEVVLVEYPRKGLWSLAFVTNDANEGEVQQRTQDEVISVFIPTTPNPTSGWLLFVPKGEIIYLKMTVDEAFKMIISGGVLTPENAPQAESHQSGKPN
ncbi:MAG: DUF502 domain-containing protein, partial [Myxococcota bacterium]